MYFISLEGAFINIDIKRLVGDIIWSVTYTISTQDSKTQVDIKRFLIYL